MLQARHGLVLPHGQAVDHPEHDGLQGAAEEQHEAALCPNPTEPTVKSAYINDERHDEHDQRQLQLRVSDVAQQHLLQLEQRNYS